MERFRDQKKCAQNLSKFIEWYFNVSSVTREHLKFQVRFDIRGKDVHGARGFALVFAGWPETIWTHLVLTKMPYIRSE